MTASKNGFSVTHFSVKPVNHFLTLFIYFISFIYFFSVITTENLPIEALCFLCGSAGEEELLFCKSCCEPYHPFCLNPEELPMTSEAEVNWLCRKCIQCQVKSAFYLLCFIFSVLSI